MEQDGIEFPDTDIVTAREMVQVIDRRLDGSVSTSNERTLALAIGHVTTDSGAFRSKLAGLSKYDLLTGRGERELTPLAYDLLENESDALEKIISDQPLFAAAHAIFGSDLPSYEAWSQFLDDEGVTEFDERDSKKAWKQYVTMARKLPENSDEADKPEVDEAEIKRYLGRLPDDQMRPFAVEALKDVTKHPLPSALALDRILTHIENEKYPEYTEDFVGMVKNICYTNPRTTVDGHDERIITLGQSLLETADEADVRHDAWQILVERLPEELDDDHATALWDIAMSLLGEGIENDVEAKRQDANRIVRKLADEWIAGQNDLLTQFEEYIWEEIGGNDEYDEIYRSWLKRFRGSRGLR